MYKVLMFGDRDWSDASAIHRVVYDLIEEHGTQNLLIIEGGATGADQMSFYIARKENVHVAEIKALWNTRHNSAGPQRNVVMANLDPDEAFCFHSNLTKSRGSADMKRRLEKLGIKVTLVEK